MYAVVVTGGKQYRVSVGDIIEVEKLNGDKGTKVDLEVIMKVDGDSVVTDKGSATAEIVSQGKDKKIVVFKYKAKKNVRKKKGHRQFFTRIKIVNIA